MKLFYLILCFTMIGNVSAGEQPLVFFDFDGIASEGRNSEGSISIGKANARSAGRSAPSGGPVKFGLDVGDREVSSVQFVISSAKGLVDSADLTGCDAYLPDTHIGGCKVKGDQVLFYAFSPVNAKLETGLLGEITFRRPVNLGALKISEEIMGDTKGSEIRN